MNKAEQVNQLHEQAMEIADEAFLAERAKEADKTIELYQQAFELEKQAAMMMVLDYETEPSRSVLFKGAACLALNSKNYKEAERMVFLGLSGNPPIQIGEELRLLLVEINQLKALSTVATLSPIEKYHQLPKDLQQQVADFIDFVTLKRGVAVTG